MLPTDPTPEPERPAGDTGRELWREREGDYYADSIHVTESGAIGINVGGRVIVAPLQRWFAALTEPERQREPKWETFSLPEGHAHLWLPLPKSADSAAALLDWLRLIIRRTEREGL